MLSEAKQASQGCESHETKESAAADDYGFSELLAKSWRADTSEVSRNKFTI